MVIGDSFYAWVIPTGAASTCQQSNPHDVLEDAV